MVNVHQICRLCMADIGIHGVDCSTIADMRNAIEILYKLEIKADDECSKRVCQKCVALVADFILHQRTVKDTQEKIKQCIELQKQINNTRVLIKEEINDESAQNAVQQGMSNDDAPAPASNGTNSTQRKNAAKTETVPKQNNRIVAHGEARSRARSSEKRISRNQSGGVSTNEAQSRLRNVVNGDAPYPVRSTRCTSNERIPSEKKRRRSAVHDTNEQTENPRIKRSKSSQRSDDGSAVARNSQNKSPPNHSKSSAATPKPQRNRRLNDSVLSSNGQGTILKYLSKPACSKCGAVVKTLPESRFHEKCHAQKQCTVCKKPVRTNDVKNHLYTCLLMCGKLTTNEMLPYMTRVSVKVLKTESARTEIDNTDNAANAIVSGDGSDRDSDIVRRAKRVIRPITIDSSSEEEIKDTASATVNQSVNAVGDTNSATVQGETATEMPTHKKKVVRRSSTVQIQEKCVSKFGKNTSLPITWNRLATNNRLFYTQTSYPKMSNHYIAVGSMVKNSQLKELERVRLKIGASVRNVAANADKETPARKLSAVHRFSNTRMSISGEYMNRVPSCDGERLVKHANAVVLFPATFDAKESPRKQPSQSKDRRKSIHSISIGTGAVNRVGESEPSNAHIPIVARPVTVPSVHAPAQSPRKMPQPNGQLQLSSPVSYHRPNDPRSNDPRPNDPRPNDQRPIVFYAPLTITSSIVPTTSAAAIAAYSSPPTSVFTPATSAPQTAGFQKSVVKVLSVNELNSRAAHAIQLNNNENMSTQNHIAHVNGIKMKYVPIAPKLPMLPEQPAHPDQPNPNNAGEENVHPIHVTLIRRQTNELELTLTQGGQRMTYDSLTESQRIQVQKSLLDGDVWQQMLQHVRVGMPSQHTLELFRLLLPQEQRSEFFNSYYAAKGLKFPPSTQ